MPINGVPLLGLWLNQLDKIGCNEVIVNTHYLANDVEKFISDQYYEDMSIMLSHKLNYLVLAEHYGKIALSSLIVTLL